MLAINTKLWRCRRCDLSTYWGRSLLQGARAGARNAMAQIQDIVSVKTVPPNSGESGRQYTADGTDAATDRSKQGPVRWRLLLVSG